MYTITNRIKNSITADNIMATENKRPIITNTTLIAINSDIIEEIVPN